MEHRFIQRNNIKGTSKNNNKKLTAQTSPKEKGHSKLPRILRLQNIY